MFIGIFMFHFYTGKDYKIYILKKKIPSLMGECKLFFYFYCLGSSTSQNGGVHEYE